MSTDVKVPNIGDFAEVEVIEVMVKVGDTIKVDQSLITVESDKASMEVPSSHAGVVKEIKVKVGDKVKEGVSMLVVEAAAGDAAGSPAAAPAPAAAAPAPAAAAPAPAPATAPAAPMPTMGDLAGLNLTRDPLDLKSSVALVLDQNNAEVLFEKNSAAAHLPARRPRQRLADNPPSY